MPTCGEADSRVEFPYEGEDDFNRRIYDIAAWGDAAFH